jgi:hypothetical protein
MEELTVDQWRERILESWAKWGTGEPLDPRTVEHLAVEFAKPMEISPRMIWGLNEVARVRMWEGDR